MPLFEQRNTITMAPFSGESDICPREGAFTVVQVHYGNMSVQVNTGNVHRICLSFLPPRLEVAAHTAFTPRCAAQCVSSDRGRHFLSQHSNMSSTTLNALRSCSPQTLAEICHSGYLDALRFLRERGESSSVTPHDLLHMFVAPFTAPSSARHRSAGNAARGLRRRAPDGHSQALL